MLGAMVFVMADTGRIVRLSEGLCRPDDEAAAVAHMVAFLTAGIRFGTPVPATRSVKNAAARTLARQKVQTEEGIAGLPVRHPLRLFHSGKPSMKLLLNAVRPAPEADRSRP